MFILCEFCWDKSGLGMNSPLSVTSSAARYSAENVFLASFQGNLRESKHKRNGLLFISLTFGSSSSSLFG